MAKTADVEQVMLEALERALADSCPRKLHGTKASPGIFLSSSATARAAAHQCLERELLRQVAEQRIGKRLVPLFAIAPPGVAMVLESSPVPRLLAAMVDAADQTAQSAANCGRTLQAVGQRAVELREAVERVAARVQPASHARLSTLALSASCSGPSPADRAESLQEELVKAVRTHKSRAPLEPIELPELFRQVATKFETLSIGQFHDTVRQLSGSQRLRLMPYTRAMYQLAQPEYALIVGREIMYYVELGSNSRG
jgi:hypothetical protein